MTTARERAERLADRWHYPYPKDEVSASIAQEIIAAEEAARADEREACAGIATEHLAFGARAAIRARRTP